MMINEFNFTSLAAALWPICRAAGAAILNCQDAAIRHKADASPVTAADMASHGILQRELPGVLDIPLVSEEAHLPSTFTAPLYWLVDPLDGTKEFLAGNGEFVVCIALMQNQHPTMGYIYHPTSQTAYWGGRQWGSFKRHSDNEDIRIHCRRANFDEPMTAWVSRQGATQEALWIQRLAQHWPSGVLQRPLGSALKACYLAEGNGDLYPRRGRTCYWDTAAAQAILQGAGGEFYAVSGQPLGYPSDGDGYNSEFIALADTSLPWFDLLGINK